MIVTNLKELSESKRRLFRKKRQQIMKKTNLKRIKNGVYLLPFENFNPSENEIRTFELIEDLIRELHIEANYFYASHVKPEHLLEGDASENGIFVLSRPNLYFVLKPIKVMRK